MTKALTAQVYTTDGKEKETITLPESVFGVAWNPDLVHQVVVGMQANARAGRPGAHAKDRSEVRGGGKKPWRQKGTGRARHGSRRSPIWVGGGVTHGPLKDKDYSVSIPKKMRVKALYSALSQKLRDGEIIFVDTLTFNAPKTQDAARVIATLGNMKGFEALTQKKTNAGLVATGTSDVAFKKSFSNLGSIGVEEVRNLNPVDVLQYKYLIISDPAEAVATLEKRSA